MVLMRKVDVSQKGREAVLSIGFLGQEHLNRVANLGPHGEDRTDGVWVDSRL